MSLLSQTKNSSFSNIRNQQNGILQINSLEKKNPHFNVTVNRTRLSDVMFQRKNKQHFSHDQMYQRGWAIPVSGKKRISTLHQQQNSNVHQIPTQQEQSSVALLDQKLRTHSRESMHHWKKDSKLRFWSTFGQQRWQSPERTSSNFEYGGFSQTGSPKVNPTFSSQDNFIITKPVLQDTSTYKTDHGIKVVGSQIAISEFKSNKKKRKFKKDAKKIEENFSNRQKSFTTFQKKWIQSPPKDIVILKKKKPSTQVDSGDFGNALKPYSYDFNLWNNTSDGREESREIFFKMNSYGARSKNFSYHQKFSFDRQSSKASRYQNYNKQQQQRDKHNRSIDAPIETQLSNTGTFPVHNSHEEQNHRINTISSPGSSTDKLFSIRGQWQNLASGSSSQATIDKYGKLRLQKWIQETQGNAQDDINDLMQVSSEQLIKQKLVEIINKPNQQFLKKVPKQYRTSSPFVLNNHPNKWTPSISQNFTSPKPYLVRNYRLQKDKKPRIQLMQNGQKKYFSPQSQEIKQQKTEIKGAWKKMSLHKKFKQSNIQNMIGPSQVAYKVNIPGLQRGSRRFMEQDFDYLKNIPSTVPQFYERFNRNIKQVVTINHDFNQRKLSVGGQNQTVTKSPRNTSYKPFRSTTKRPLASKISSPPLSPRRLKATHLEQSPLSPQFQDFKNFGKETNVYEKCRKKSLPNLAIKSPTMSQERQKKKIPLQQKLKLFDLQRRKMASTFGLTSTNIKDMLLKIKQKVQSPQKQQFKTVTQAQIEEEHISSIKQLHKSSPKKTVVKIQSTRKKQQKMKEMEDRHLQQFAKKQRNIEMQQSQSIIKFEDCTHSGSHDEQLDFYLQNPVNYQIDDLNKIKEFEHLQFSSKLQSNLWTIVN